MQVRSLVSSIVVLCLIAVGTVGPSFAMGISLTQDDKRDIYNRCKDAGGSFKACCAAANGTVKTDPKNGSTYCDWTSTVSGSSTKHLSPPVLAHQSMAH